MTQQPSTRTHHLSTNKHSIVSGEINKSFICILKVLDFLLLSVASKFSPLNLTARQAAKSISFPVRRIIFITTSIDSIVLISTTINNTTMMKRSDTSSKAAEAPRNTMGATTKRRALGDITNAVRHEETKGNAQKKPVPQTRSATVSAGTATAASALTDSMAVEDAQLVREMDNRAYMQRPSDNIDERDDGNILLVTEYVDPMYGHFNHMERAFMVDPTYMTSQQHINEKMRAILIDWLVRNL